MGQNSLISNLNALGEAELILERTILVQYVTVF